MSLSARDTDDNVTSLPPRRRFATPALQHAFERHVTAAQSAFLRGDSVAAERAVVLALRIRPTAHLFALLAVLAESRGQYDRASDWRLLQAFLARSATLWRELLHDCLAQQRYYQAVVCLQRLSALERHDAAHYRALQLQLADVLIGLGEVRRAANVLVPLWTSSRCRDFEVFALLSSLYFQLGKWSSLQRLIESSLRYAFHVTLQSSSSNSNGSHHHTDADKTTMATTATTTRRDDANGNVDDTATATTAKAAADGSDTTAAVGVVKRKRVSKRVRFFGVDKDNDDKDEDDRDKQDTKADVTTSLRHGDAQTAASDDGGARGDDDDGDIDDFDIDATQQRLQQQQQQRSTYTSASHVGEGSATTQATSAAATTTTAAASLHIRNMYGDELRLHTPAARRGFLTLVNVHAELLNEQGKFDETIRLLHHAAACVQLPLMQLPPDLLVRLGIAYAFRGDCEADCAAIFRHLLDTCAMDECGDVLLDAAVSLQKVGMYSEALEVYTTMARYHAFQAQRLAHELADEEKAAAAAAAAVADAMTAAWTSHSTPRLIALRAERDALATVRAAAYTGQAECLYALHRLQRNGDNNNNSGNSGNADDSSRVEACRAALHAALDAEPTHLRARLLLSQLRYREDGDVDGAIAALTPRDGGEPALQRIILGHALVLLLRRTHRYIEAIALGVTLFELILSSADDGDAQSVAPGSSRGRGSSGGAAALLQQPTLSRASSAIVTPQTLLSQAGNNTSSNSNTMMAAAMARSGAAPSLSASLAASIRAGSSVVTQQLLAHRGRSALTTTVYGASAAASVAAGKTRRDGHTHNSKHASDDNDNDNDNEDDAAAAADRDGSAIFRFHRRRTQRVRVSSAAAMATTDKAKGDDDEEGAATRLQQRRVAAVTQMPAAAFWRSDAHDDADADGAEEEQQQQQDEDGGGTAVTQGDGGSNEQQQQQQTTATRSKRTRTAALSSSPSTAAASRSHRARTRRRTETTDKKDDDDDDDAVGSDDDARERDLAELERCYATTTTTRGDGSNNDDNDNGTDSSHCNSTTDECDSFALPSLEEVSAQFADPLMAQLFLHASSSNPLDSNNNNSSSNIVNAAAAAAAAGGGGAHDTAAVGVVDHVTDRATARDVLRTLGRHALLQLAVTVVECYSAVGRFTEAKEFAGLMLVRFAQRRLFRQMGSLLERPLRVALLRAALAARESEDAYRVGVRLLQEDATAPERVAVLELLHCVLGRCDDRSAIVYRLFLDGQCDVPLLVLLANRYYMTRSYTRALNLYLLALQHRPHDVLLHLLVGVSYLLCSHQKRIAPREACVSAGLYYLTRYQRLLIASDARRTGEALYNTARALQYLRLHYLCIPLYEHMCRVLRVPEECTAALRHAAQVNLYFVYRWIAGNRHAALAALPHVD